MGHLGVRAPYATRRKLRYEANQVWMNTTFISQEGEFMNAILSRVFWAKTQVFWDLSVSWVFYLRFSLLQNAIHEETRVDLSLFHFADFFVRFFKTRPKSGFLSDFFALLTVLNFKEVVIFLPPTSLHSFSSTLCPCIMSAVFSHQLYLSLPLNTQHLITVLLDFALLVSLHPCPLGLSATWWSAVLTSCPSNPPLPPPSHRELSAYSILPSFTSLFIKTYTYMYVSATANSW